MRFHKFKGRDEGYVWIDLDKVVYVTDEIGGEPREDGRPLCSMLMQGLNASLWVAESAADVLALIQPSAAPDTYEEELAVQKRMNEYRAAAAKRSRKNFIDRVIERGLGPVPPPTAAAIERLDELDRTARILLGAADAYWPRWAKDIIARRKEEITGITMSEV